MVNRGEKKVRVHMNVVPRSTMNTMNTMVEQSNGRYNPEVVGSIPTEVKRFFFASCGFLIPLTRPNAQWVVHGLN